MMMMMMMMMMTAQIAQSAARAEGCVQLLSTLSCGKASPTQTRREPLHCDREVSVGIAIVAGVRQPGHTDTASPHQRECIDLDGAATASARRVRAREASAGGVCNRVVHP